MSVYLRRHKTEGLAEWAMELTAEEMEVIRGVSDITHLRECGSELTRERKRKREREKKKREGEVEAGEMSPRHLPVAPLQCT